MRLYHLHPAAVHFPIALLTAGAAAAGARLWRRAPEWLGKTESWLLWLGTASAWITLALGLLAERTARHVPPAWEVLAEHEELAWWTCAAFSVLSSLRWYALRTGRDAGKVRVVQLFMWLSASALLVATATHGGELVYRFGMGVER